MAFQSPVSWLTRFYARCILRYSEAMSGHCIVTTNDEFKRMVHLLFKAFGVMVACGGILLSKVKYLFLAFENE